MLFEKNERIVFAGDSVTDMGSAQPVGEGLGEGLGHGYVRIIDNMLYSWYPELNIRVTNSGVCGNSSRDLIARFERDVLNLKPDYISICIGVNDVWRQFDSPQIPECAVMPEEYRQNVETMIIESKKIAKGVFVCTPYIMEPNREDWMRKRLDEYSDICRELAKIHGCILVDFQKMYEEYFAVKHPSFIAWDRIHPNTIGSTLMAKEFLKYCDFDYNR